MLTFVHLIPRNDNRPMDVYPIVREQAPPAEHTHIQSDAGSRIK